MMNSVHIFTNKFTDGILLVKMTRHHFFCFVLIFFPTVIPSVFLFVFINFLIVAFVQAAILNGEGNEKVQVTGQFILCLIWRSMAES